LPSQKLGRVFVSRLLPPEKIVVETLEPVADVKLGHGGTYTHEELVRELKDVDGILVSMRESIDKSIIESTTRLKIISKYGTGVDNVDIKAATEKGVIVANSPLNSEATAEHAILLMLACLRKLPLLFEHMHAGRWGLTIPDELLGGELYQSTVGIVGLGRVGSRVAERVKCFGTQIIGYDPYASKELPSYIKLVDLDTLLMTSDIVTLHVNLTPETEHFIGERELRLMKKSAILVNASRGGVLDIAALTKALQEGWIAMAGIDVLEQYPPPSDSPLFKLKNLVLTPHMGGSTVKARERVVRQAAENIVQVLNGKLPPLECIVNKDILKQVQR
jgi:D-3-phosphoglycerate dehydrogenase